MVDFTLTDEQKNLREMAHDFAVKEIRPVAWEYDKDGTWPQDIIEKAWEVGLMNSHIEEEYGGPGAGYLDGCLIEEELSWGCSGIQTSLGCNGLATAPIALGGSEEIKKKYLGALTEAPSTTSTNSPLTRCTSAASHAGASPSVHTWVSSNILVNSRANRMRRSAPITDARSATLSATRCGAS